MKSLRLSSSLILLLILSPSAIANGVDLLTIIPTDAVSVGIVRLSELRSSPLATRIFSHCDRITVEGEAERFLTESGFNPMEDLDTVAFALSPDPSEPRDGEVLLVAEGRFEVDRLSGAIEKRGGERLSSEAGTYYRLPAHENEQGALAFVNSRLALAGSESAVIEALGAIARGGTDFVHAAGIAHLLSRIDSNATAWMLIDIPRSARIKDEGNWPGSGDRDEALRRALKTVSVVGVWANDQGDQWKLGATAISRDPETLGLLEDLLRGMLATWRLAAQEKAPELVLAIRKFEVERGSDSVTLSGEIAAELLQKFSSRPRKSYGK